MPQLIEHIDAIARTKQRDVLYVTFNPAIKPDAEYDFETLYDWEQDPIRKTVCKWLTEHNIPWQECGHIADENYMSSYEGQLYLDIPFDENDPQYQVVRDYLENPDGTMRLDPVCWWYLPLERAMENAHHDEPGFWEKWAEDF
jgi:hypothetical protein